LKFYWLINIKIKIRFPFPCSFKYNCYMIFASSFQFLYMSLPMIYFNNSKTIILHSKNYNSKTLSYSNQIKNKLAHKIHYNPPTGYSDRLNYTVSPSTQTAYNQPFHYNPPIGYSLSFFLLLCLLIFLWFFFCFFHFYTFWAKIKLIYVWTTCLKAPMFFYHLNHSLWLSWLSAC